MPKPLVFNSTPLIYLTKVSLTQLLNQIHVENITTSRVYQETVVQGKKKGAPEALLLEGLLKKKIISIHEPKDKKFVKTLTRIAADLEQQPLHEAEAEVLAVANEVNGVAIIDDKATRSVAVLFGIESHGTGYVLGRIHLNSKISKEKLIHKIREMREAGWYISAEDYLDIIKYVEAL